MYENYLNYLNGLNSEIFYEWCEELKLLVMILLGDMLNIYLINLKTQIFTMTGFIPFMLDLKNGCFSMETQHIIKF